MLQDDAHEAAFAWFERGDKDLTSARLLLEAEPPQTENAAFLCQQAAEKHFKGFLAYFGEDPPYTHNLVALLDIALVRNKQLEALREDARTLGRFAIEVRYPFFESPPDREEAEQAFAQAKNISSTIYTCMGETE